MSVVRKAVVLSLVALVLALGGGASQALAGDNAAGLRAADDAWMKAYNAGELDNVVALYDGNAVIYPPGIAPVRGRDALKEFFTGDMAGFAKTGLTIMISGTTDNGVSGDMGWSSGSWAVKDKAGAIVDTGWFFSVSKKVKGKWLYVRDTWNSNKPGAAAAAMAAPSGN